MYEIPQQLTYQERIIFNLTFGQLVYGFIFLPIAFNILFNGSGNLYVRFFLALFPFLLGVGFMFFNFQDHIKNYIKWYKQRKLDSLKIERYFQIKEINKDLIITNKKKLAMLQIEPLNFGLKPDKEKETIILSFQKLLNSLDFPFQILMTTEHLRIDDYLKRLKERVVEPQVYEDYEKHMNEIVSKDGVTNRNFYLVIPETSDINIQLQLCQDRLASLNLKTKRLHTNEIKNVLQNLFDQKTSFLPEKIYNNTDSLLINDKYSRVIYAHGYPRTVESGFLDKIISSQGNFNISMHIEPTTLENTMVSLNKELLKQRADLYSAKIKNQLNPSLEIQYKDTLKTLEYLQKGDEKLFDMSFYITCKADSKNDLDLLTRKIESELNALLIIPKQANFRQLEGLKSCLPLTENALKIKRNITTKALSAFFPFTSSFFSFDETGIWFGLNQNNIPIIKDPFKLSNANGICLASSGSGKSYLAKLLISRHLMNGTDVIVIDPQSEYTDLVNQYNGQRIDLSRTSKTIINPLDLMGHSYPEKRLALMDLMPVMLGDLSEPQKSFIDKALTEAYEKKGIFMDESLSWNNEPPILEDVLKVLERLEKKATQLEKTTIRSLINRFDMYVSGVFSFLNRHTQINFSNKFVCLDIGNLAKQVKPTMMFLLLDYVYTKMKGNLERKLLVVDEAWSLLSKTEEASYIFEIVKTCRKYNLGLFLINQEVEDMLQSKAGRSVLANSSHTILLRQKPSVIDSIVKTFYLSDTEKNALLTANVGDGLLIMENEHSKLRVVASGKEHKIISTNADEKLASKTKVIEDKLMKNKQQKKVAISVDENKGLFKLNKLNKDEIEYLKKKRYIEFKSKGINNKKPEIYLIKPRYNESPQHCFLTYDIAKYLESLNGVKDVKLFETKKPDIVFSINDKEYAIEVETGKVLKKNKKQLMEKVKTLNKEYGERWFFITTNKNLAPVYNKIAPTCEKRYITNRIEKLLTSAKQSPQKNH